MLIINLDKKLYKFNEKSDYKFFNSTCKDYEFFLHYKNEWNFFTHFFVLQYMLR